jgi:hypothetical protein
MKTFLSKPILTKESENKYRYTEEELEILRTSFAYTPMDVVAYELDRDLTFYGGNNMQHDLSEPQNAAPGEGSDGGRVTQFSAACKSGKEIFIKKNEEYGDSISSTGVLGAVTTLVGDTARLRKLVLKASDRGRSEQKLIVEVLKDIHNYANIALMMIADKNWDGPD